MPSPTVSIPSWRESRSGVSPGQWDGSKPPSGEGISAPSSPAALVLVDLTHFELAERLVQVWVRNQRNLNRFEELTARIEGANRRLASSRPGRPIVEAHRQRLRAQRLTILQQLRGDERLASALIGEIEARRRASGESPRAQTA